MNREQIIRMAREAGLIECSEWGDQYKGDLNALKKLAALVAAAEREECANVALNEPRVWDKDAQDPQHRIAAAILARGKQ